VSRVEWDFKEITGAVDSYNQAVKLEPGDFLGRVCRGYARLLLNQLEELKIDAEAALEINPDHPLSCWLKGRSYMDPAGGNTLDAIRWFDRGITARADSFLNRSARAHACWVADFEAALEAERAVKLNPVHPFGLFLRGALRYNLARFVSNGEEEVRLGVADLEKSSRSDPGFSPTWAKLAEIYLDQGRFEEALAACARAQALGHSDKPTIERIGQAARERR
jgi:cytochrome c-type biogenesis protein CcmH/NrfG